MKKNKIAAILVLIMVMAFALSACSLFGGGDEDPSGLPELKKRFYVSTGEYYVTNVLDSDMLVKVSMELLLNKDKTDLITQNLAGIRNIIVQTLREKTQEELLAVDALSNLETELTEKVGNLLAMEEFIQVVISDYVVQ